MNSYIPPKEIKEMCRKTQSKIFYERFRRNPTTEELTHMTNTGIMKEIPFKLSDRNSVYYKLKIKEIENTLTKKEKERKEKAREKAKERYEQLKEKRARIQEHYNLININEKVKKEDNIDRLFRYHNYDMGGMPKEIKKLLKSKGITSYPQPVK